MRINKHNDHTFAQCFKSQKLIFTWGSQSSLYHDYYYNYLIKPSESRNVKWLPWEQKQFSSIAKTYLQIFISQSFALWTTNSKCDWPGKLCHITLKFHPGWFSFFKYILLIMPLQFSHFFLPFMPPLPCTSLALQHLPLFFMPMDRTYKFFGFSISYTILNTSLSILYLPTMLLIPCTFPPILPLPLPTENPPCDLHFSGSVSVLIVCLVFVFVFQVQLLMVLSVSSHVELLIMAREF